MSQLDGTGRWIPVLLVPEGFQPEVDVGYLASNAYFALKTASGDWLPKLYFGTITNVYELLRGAPRCSEVLRGAPGRRYPVGKYTVERLGRPSDSIPNPGL